MEESAFAPTHTPEKLQHADDKEESSCAGEGRQGETEREHTRNGVYSSCFFYRTLTPLLYRPRRESSALLHDKIALLYAGTVGEKREKPRSTTERNPPAHALILRFSVYACACVRVCVCIEALSRKYLNAVGCPRSFRGKSNRRETKSRREFVSPADFCGNSCDV